MVDQPRAIADISAEWLSGALGSRVDRIEAEVIGSGVGFMGQIARVRLVSRDIPMSVIVKIPSADPGAQMIGGMMRVWEREHRFYTEVASKIRSVRLPRCFSAVDDPYVLVLEDLAPAYPGDQVAGPTENQARAVVDTAASLHSEWFARPELTTYDWMPDLNDPSTEAIGQLSPLGGHRFSLDTAIPSLLAFCDGAKNSCRTLCRGYTPTTSGL